jgi:putative transposase
MREMFRRRHLPHWSKPGATYFVTACLAGSIPAQGLLALRRLADGKPVRPCPIGAPPAAQRVARERAVFACREDWLDSKPAVRLFADHRRAAIARKAIEHHSGTRYHLHAFVVMPSHIHCVLTPEPQWERTWYAERLRGHMTPLSAIMHSIKSFIAREVRVLRGSSGPLWQGESYDRIVRDETELERTVAYVEYNPVKAGLCVRPEEWAFSSASAGQAT